MKSFALFAVVLFACVTALAWTPLSLQRIETKQVKIIVDTLGTTKNIESIDKVALQRMASQIENAFRDDRAVLDSNFSKWGIDTVGSLDSTTVTIGVTYESADSYAASPTPEKNLANALYCTSHTTTTFVVNNSNNTTVVFRWVTIGRK